MQNVDVFISHKLEDLAKARQLKGRIQQWGFSCYIDADDETLQHITNPKLLADRIRTRLRTSRCLLFAFTPVSSKSKWMPWELGFFDGRWSQNQIGLYNLDEIEIDFANIENTNDNSLSFQEYLRIYKLVKLEYLREFIQECVAAKSLANRADVDADRLAMMIEGAARDPFRFYVGCLQYGLGLQRAMLASAPVQAAFGSIVAPLDEMLAQTAGALDRIRDTASGQKYQLPVLFNVADYVGSVRDLHERGIQQLSAPK